MAKFRELLNGPFLIVLSIAIAAILVMTLGGSLSKDGAAVLGHPGAAGFVAQGDVINVLTDCEGVVGDACTNDGPAINRCLLANPGRTFFFPRTKTPYAHPQSDYYSGETINVQQGQTLVGEGRTIRGTTISFTPNCGGPPTDALPNFDGVTVDDFVTIRNLHFQGNIHCSRVATRFGAPPGAPVVPTNARDGIAATGGWLNLEDVSVCGFGRDGITVTSDSGVFEGVFSSQNYRYGFHFQNARDSHINTCIGCTAIQNQEAGLHDESRGNTYINMLFDSNVFVSAQVADNSRSVFISPWFEGSRPAALPNLGMKSMVFASPSAMGARPDWSRSPSWIETDVANGGGYTRVVNLVAQPEAWADGSRVNARSTNVFGTGIPSAYGTQPPSWYVRNLSTLATVAFGESAERGWWCFRSLGWDQPGLASSSICFADSGPNGVLGNWQADGNGGPTRAWLPNGVYWGSGTTERRINVRVEGRAQSGSCTPGVDDIVFADSFVAGGHIGWVCLDVGTWQTFGEISSSSDTAIRAGLTPIIPSSDPPIIPPPEIDKEPSPK